jgi:hypothetical protein
MNKQEVFQVMVSNTAVTLTDIETQNSALCDRLGVSAENSIDHTEIVIITL